MSIPAMLQLAVPTFPNGRNRFYRHRSPRTIHWKCSMIFVVDPSLAHQSNYPHALIRPSFGKAFRALFWSPLLLLTRACACTLCQPRTKKFFTALMILDIPLQWGTHIDINPSVDYMGALGGFDFSITTISLLALHRMAIYR